MPSYLVESYVPRSPGALEEASLQARRAAELATSGGSRVEYVRTTLLGTEETCFHVFIAGSAGDVELALIRVGLSADRVVPAVETSGRDHTDRRSSP